MRGAPTLPTRLLLGHQRRRGLIGSLLRQPPSGTHYRRRHARHRPGNPVQPPRTTESTFEAHEEVGHLPKARLGAAKIL